MNAQTALPRINIIIWGIYCTALSRTYNWEKYFQHTCTPDRVKSEKDRDRKTLKVQGTHHELSRGVPPWHVKSAKNLKKGSPCECCKYVNVKANVKSKRYSRTVRDNANIFFI